jgi:hypothetical protein
MVGAHHVQKINVWRSVAIQVGEAGVTAPPARFQPHFRSDVPKFSSSKVPIEDRILEPLRVHVPGERVGKPHVVAVVPFGVRGILPDVAD